MSILASVGSSPRERTLASAGDRKTKPKRARHTPGGAGLGKEATTEARRLAAAILEVLAGARTPSQAAQALSMSVPRYYQLEARAMQALVAGCETRPRGPRPRPDQELVLLRQQQQRLERELGRQQALVRLAQRTLGLSPARPEAARPGTAPPGGKGKGKRKRRAVVRALHAARHLVEQSAAETVPVAAGAAAEELTR